MTIRTTLGCMLAAALTAAASAAPPPTSLIALLGGGIVSWEHPTHRVIPGLIALGDTFPAGIATTSTGDLLASHLGGGVNSIRRFSTSGEELAPFVSGGSIYRSIAVTPSDDVLAVTGTTEVRRFSSAGVYQNTPHTAPANYQLDDLLVTPAGTGFALQRYRSSPVVASIEVFDPVTGTDLGSISMPPGSVPGTTYAPRDMELGPDGNIYFITGPDTSIYRVAATPGAIPFPIAVLTESVDTFAIGPDGLIYAARSGTIKRYALDGTDLGVFATFEGGGGITRLHFGNAISSPAGGCVPPN